MRAMPEVTAIVPLKALAEAKSRLAGELDDDARRAVVAWMFERVIRACRQARRVADVLVVAGDHEAASLAHRCGVRVLRQPRPGLRAALDEADREVAGARASLVVAADLPLATGEDLDRVCAADDGPAAGIVVVAPTRDGGTGAMLRRPTGIIHTAYGADSAAAHLALARANGVRARRIDVAALALDVDTAAQLHEAGYGARALSAAVTAPGSGDITTTGARMPQGTVKHFDYETSSGTVLLDNADELPIDAETFAASGLLELRLGQRVRFEVDQRGQTLRLRNLTIVSL